MLIIFIYGNLFGQDISTKKAQESSKITTLDSKELKVLANEEDRKVAAQAIKNLEFEFDKATIASDSYVSLNGLPDWLKEKNFTLKVSGYADFIGSEDYNLRLSTQRAVAVKTYWLSREQMPTLLTQLPLEKASLLPVMLQLQAGSKTGGLSFLSTDFYFNGCQPY